MKIKKRISQWSNTTDILIKRLTFLLFLFVSIDCLAGGKVVKILAIGNSFSRDAVEQNLWDLAKANGEECIIGNMYIGGCSINYHVKNLRENAKAYEYRKIGINGIRIQYNKETLDEALRDEQWDYVTVQQVSDESGIYESYSKLPELIDYIKARVPQTTKILLHQTWAYAQHNTHPKYWKYGKSQQKMYRAIVKTCDQVAQNYHLDGIIPAGMAIQIARGTTLGDRLNRDGYHLSYVRGRYIAACCWYEYIWRKSVVGNSYAPEGMSEETKALCQESADKACQEYGGLRDEGW